MGVFGCWCDKGIPLKDIPCEGGAAFISDHAKEAFVDACAKELADFVAAVAGGRRAEWIVNVLPSGYEDYSDEVVITDLISRQMDARFRSLLECPACGRIYMENVRQGNRFVGFKPEPTIPACTLHFEQRGAAGFVTSQTEPATLFGSDDCPGQPPVPLPEDSRGENYGRLVNREKRHDEPSNNNGNTLG